VSAQPLDWSSGVPQTIGARRAPADQLKGLKRNFPAARNAMARASKPGHPAQLFFVTALANSILF